MKNLKLIIFSMLFTVFVFAQNSIPIACFKVAIADREITAKLTPVGVMKLCSGATSFAPITCFKEGIVTTILNDKLTPVGIMQLCTQGGGAAD
jgi:hypothetical protein